MATYNKYYKKQNYFGKPYPELLKYLDKFDRCAKILDLGCGQGRDVLALGRLGFDVKGIDLSDVGIKQLNQIASEELLNVKGIVGDYKAIDFIPEFDIVLMNSMFHFYKSDIHEEDRTLLRILDMMKNNGVLVLIVQESEFRINHIKDLIQSSNLPLIIDYEESFIYQEFNSKFYMVSIIKNIE